MSIDAGTITPRPGAADPGTARPARKPGPSLRLSLVVLIVGAAIVVPSGVLIGVRLFRGIDAPSMATPGAARRHLGKGTWVVYERTGSRHGVGITFTQNADVTIDPTEVTVTGPDGSTLTVDETTVSETITRGSSIYTGAVQFRVPRPGVYTVQVDTPEPGQVLVGRSLGDTFRSLIAPVLAGAGGGLLVGVGIVLFIIGTVRRNRSDRRMAFPGGWAPGPGPVQPAWAPWPGWAPGPGQEGGVAWAPGARAVEPGAGPGSHPGPVQPGAGPGWYPDPGRPGAQRWWDGSRWTEHQH